MSYRLKKMNTGPGKSMSCWGKSANSEGLCPYVLPVLSLATPQPIQLLPEKVTDAIGRAYFWISHLDQSSAQGQSFAFRPMKTNNIKYLVLFASWNRGRACWTVRLPQLLMTWTSVQTPKNHFEVHIYMIYVTCTHYACNHWNTLEHSSRCFGFPHVSTHSPTNIGLPMFAIFGKPPKLTKTSSSRTLQAWFHLGWHLSQ